LAGVGVLAAAVGVASALAAPSSKGTVSVGKPARLKFGAVGGPSGATNDVKLTVHLPKSASVLYHPNARTGTDYAAVLTIRLTWKGSAPDDALGIKVMDASGKAVGNDTTGVTNHGGDVNLFMLQDPKSATYTVQAYNQSATGPQSTSATPSSAVATLKVVHLSAFPGPPAPAGAPGFTNYHIPLKLMPVQPEEKTVLHGRAFGEPSIGVDPRTNATMYQAGLDTMKGVFNWKVHPARVTWTNVSALNTHSVSEDAILDVDRRTGRTFVSQLILACSLSAYSNNDGKSWTPAAKACQTPPAIDHETIGAGPFAPPLKGLVYPDAVYYCSQNVGEAECALSVDGGNTYGPAEVMWNSSQCFGLHGHIKIAPDGTAYVPNKGCGAPECLIATSTATPACHPGFAVSRDNGATWTIHLIKDQHSRYFDTGDPSIGIGSKGTMYFGNNNANGDPMVTVCRDHGTRCARSINVGARYHIHSVEMPSMVAGDDNRAAFAFLGSTTPGDDQQSNVQLTNSKGQVINKVLPWDDFMGTWHLYIATTYDGGKHWKTVDATRKTPVQRGCIEFAASCPSTRASDDQRNLLDFNDLAIDKFGRIEAAYTDGCQPDLGPPKNHGSCLTDATRLSGLDPEIQGPAVAVQSCGPGLYARFDSMMKPCPHAKPPTHHKTHHHHKHQHHHHPTPRPRPPKKSRGFTG
jgi:hypothetical protein